MDKQLDTLSKYGTPFQLKTITCLVKYPEFLEQIRDLVNPKYYEAESQQWIIKTTMKYFDQYKKSPTLEVFKIEMDRDITNETMKMAIVNELRIIFQNFAASDLDYVKENFLHFTQNQEMKKAVLESVDLLDKGEYENIRHRIDVALKAGQQRDLGVIWKEEEYFNRRILETLRSPVATPWTPINEITDGGLGEGEMGVVVAPAGLGKSWLLVAIGRYAASMGKNVIHYTLELSDDYVSLRYDANTTGYAPQDIKFHQEEVFNKVKKVQGNVIVKGYPTKNASIETLRSHILRVSRNDFEPDILIVDYGDLLRGNVMYSTSEKRFELENIFEEMRGLAGEWKVPLWTASQANRSSLEDEVIEANRIAESYNKIMIADFVMSLQRRTKDKLAHTGKIHVIKNRFGPDGFIFPTRMNAATGIVEMFKEQSDTGRKINAESDKGEVLQKRKISSKLDEILSAKKGNTDTDGMG